MTLVAASWTARTMASVVAWSRPPSWQTASTKLRANGSTRRSLGRMRVQGRFAAPGHRPLRSRQAARRLQGHAADDRLAAADAAEHAPMTVALGANAAVLGDEGVVVAAAPGGGDGETGAVLEGHHRRQRQQPLGQGVRELGE